MKRIFPALIILGIAVSMASCEKLSLQKDYKYNPSVFSTTIDMTVWDFMNSRKDLFSGMLSAISYVDSDPQYADVKKLFTEPAPNTTFLLLTNTALIDMEDANSYYSKIKWTDTDPASPTYNQQLPGSDWSQYSKSAIADLLKYHVLKGNYELKVINSVAKWVPTYALSTTNDSAYVNLFLVASRDAYLNINSYTGAPAGTGIRPRTPDLHCKNGVVHVMDRFFYQPTKKAIAENP